MSNDASVKLKSSNNSIPHSKIIKFLSYWHEGRRMSMNRCRIIKNYRQHSSSSFMLLIKGKISSERFLMKIWWLYRFSSSRDQIVGYGIFFFHSIYLMHMKLCHSKRPTKYFIISFYYACMNIYSIVLHIVKFSRI